MSDELVRGRGHEVGRGHGPVPPQTRAANRPRSAPADIVQPGSDMDQSACLPGLRDVIEGQDQCSSGGVTRAKLAGQEGVLTCCWLDPGDSPPLTPVIRRWIAAKEAPVGEPVPTRKTVHQGTETPRFRSLGAIGASSCTRHAGTLHGHCTEYVLMQTITTF